MPSNSPRPTHSGPKKTDTELAAERLEAATASKEKLAAKVASLRAELAKAEAAFEAAEKEIVAAAADKETAIADAERKKQMAKRWHPPCDATSRSRALGEPDDSPLAKCWQSCEALPLPKAGDWLAKGQPGEKDRPGQSVAQFCRPGRALPSRAAGVVYLAPIGSVSGAPPIRTLCDFLHAMFGLEVRELQSIQRTKAVDGVISRTADYKPHGPMINAQETLDLMHKEKPRDAFLVLGYTMEDMQAHAAGLEDVKGAGAAEEEEEPEEEQDTKEEEQGGGGLFGGLFGGDRLQKEAEKERKKAAAKAAAEAKATAAANAASAPPAFAFVEVQPNRGVGLVSFARFPGVGCTLVDIPDAVAFQYVCRSVAGHSSFLRRCVSSLGHAAGRLLGIAPDVHGRCLLNGASHLEEMDVRPLCPNPITLKKMSVVMEEAAKAGAVPTMPLDAWLAKREGSMIGFCRGHGFVDDKAAGEVRLAVFEAVLNSAQQAERQLQQNADSELERELERVREAVRRDAAATRELARLDAAAAATKPAAHSPPQAASNGSPPPLRPGAKGAAPAPLGPKAGNKPEPMVAPRGKEAPAAPPPVVKGPGGGRASLGGQPAAAVKGPGGGRAASPGPKERPKSPAPQRPNSAAAATKKATTAR